MENQSIFNRGTTAESLDPEPMSRPGIDKHFYLWILPLDFAFSGPRVTQVVSGNEEFLERDK